jgi:hypothetical protein
MTLTLLSRLLHQAMVKAKAQTLSIRASRYVRMELRTLVSSILGTFVHLALDCTCFFLLRYVARYDDAL